MKRSKGISLILMGSLSLAGTAYGAEKAEEGMYTFSSVEECAAGKAFTQTQCEQMSRQAAARSPRFRSREECEAKFGADACVQNSAQNGTVVRSNTGGMWRPTMAGFMAGHFLGSNGMMMQGAQGLYRDPAADTQQGISYRTATGDTVKPGPGGKVQNPSPSVVQSFQHNARPMLSRSGSGSRGGFAGGVRASS